MSSLRTIALSGGVGGAKLALGLSKVLEPEALLIVANTGDDFEHLGLHIAPDLDTVMYTLAGLSNPETGWGLQGETWQFLGALGELGGETWFRLGDRDLATHVERTRQLAAGNSLGAVTATLCASLDIRHPIVPMTDDRVRTIVHSLDGPLDFQHYFVRDQCAPQVTGFSFDGIEAARPSPPFLEALADSDRVVICPSNPYVSVDPILGLEGVSEALRRPETAAVAVSPIVGGEALKGPAAKMMRELDLPSTAFEVARHYTERGLLDGFVLDRVDEQQAGEVEDLGLRVRVTNTIMTDLGDRIRLAEEVLSLGDEIAGSA